MTRQDLEQLRPKMIELTQLQRRLERARKERAHDAVLGSRWVIPYDKHLIPIEGVAVIKAAEIEACYEKRCEALAEEIIRAEAWIDSIADGQLRTILRLHYVEGVGQAEIAENMGYTRQAVSMIIKRHFDKV